MSKEPFAPLPSHPLQPPHDAADTLAVLGPVARSSVVDAVADRLRGEILAGRLAPGTRLPSERELSLALGVNRLTLRAALARLEALGLVATKHGAGTIVAAWREKAGLDSLAALIGSLDPSDPAWFELACAMLEMRAIVATEAVALAAVRHKDEDMATLIEIAEAQKSLTADPIAYARGELAFQRALIRTTGNLALELVLNTFARFPDDLPEIVTALYDHCEDAAVFYDQMIALLRSRDPVRARETMRMAFTAMDEDWMRRHKPPGATLPAPADAKREESPRKKARKAKPSANKSKTKSESKKRRAKR